MDLSQENDNKNKKVESSFAYLTAYEHQKSKDISNVYSYIYREPAIVLTALYLCISLTGISYLALVLYGFGINVLPHVELTDFVLSAIHYPKTLAISLLFFALLILSSIVESYLGRKWLLTQRLLNQYHKRAKHKKPFLLFVSLIILYSAIAAFLQADKAIAALKTGTQAQFNVQLATSLKIEDKKTNELNNVQIVANLSKHLWLYQSSSEQIFMIAHENVLMLSPQLTRKTVLTDSSNKTAEPKEKTTPLQRDTEAAQLPIIDKAKEVTND